jgi:hypothetical protein
LGELPWKVGHFCAARIGRHYASGGEAAVIWTVCHGTDCVPSPGLGHGKRLFQLDPSPVAPMLGTPLASGVIDEDLAHGLGRH